MSFFDYWWIPFVVFAALCVGAWSMWLEHQRKQKALEVLREAIASGREVPDQLVQALTKEKAEDWGAGAGAGGGWGHTASGGLTGVVFFILLSAGFAIAAWFGDGRQANAFWLVAGIMFAMCILTAVTAIGRLISNKPK
jgi:hypothetical protein